MQILKCLVVDVCHVFFHFKNTSLLQFRILYLQNSRMSSEMVNYALVEQIKSHTKCKWIYHTIRRQLLIPNMVQQFIYLE